jgi:hypothetical protein
MGFRLTDPTVITKTRSALRKDRPECADKAIVQQLSNPIGTSLEALFHGVRFQS